MPLGIVTSVSMRWRLMSGSRRKSTPSGEGDWTLGSFIVPAQ